MQVSSDKVYILHEKPPVFYPTHLFRDIEEHQAARLRKSKDLAKILLKERISGRSIADLVPESSYYLDSNALNMVFQENQALTGDFRYQENLVNVCGKQVVWFQGQVSYNHYGKKINCRKAWCPVCGGKGGIIHKSRKHAVLSRADFEKYNLRQLVFTVPEEMREYFRNRINLSKGIALLKLLIEKEFGVPDYKKNGNIKKWKLNKGVIFYFHAFGDRVPGIYKPHFNIHILEDKKENLFLEPERMERIKNNWLKKLNSINENIKKVDVHYSFRNHVKKSMFSIRYMSKPYSVDDYAAIDNLDLKNFLVLELHGFQFLRFWGSLANKKYRDEMELPEVLKEAESKIEEKLIPLFISPFNEESWKEKIEFIDEGFFRVKPKFKAEAEIDLKNLRLLSEKSKPHGVLLC